MDKNPKLINELKLPKSWQELVELKDIIPFCTYKVTRFPKDQQTYWDYQKTMPREEHLQKILDEIGDSDQKIVANKFPYCRLIKHIPGVKHYCLWSKAGPLVAEAVEIEIKNRFPGLEYIWFINPPINKSIPEIWHCQILVKESI